MYHSEGAMVGVKAVPDISHYDLVILRDPESDFNCHVAEIIAQMDPVLQQAWQREGGLTNNIVDIGHPTFMINWLHEPAIFTNISLNPDELGLLDLQFYSCGSNHCKYHVIQQSSTTGEIIGGKAYEVNFSSCNHHYRGNTETDSLFANRSNSFRLTQDSTDQNRSRIESIYPNPATDQVTVTYHLEEVKDAYISISNYYFKGMYDNYVLDINSRSRTFPVQNYTTGFYIVALICDGQVADVKTFIKH